MTTLAPTDMRTRAKQYGSWLRGKRCIVVGPAGYLDGQGLGDWIDSFDVVVKMNWGESLNRADYGRTDVLYKRLLKLGHADDILVQEYLDAGVQFLIGIGTRPHDKGIGYLEQVVGDRLPWFVDDSTRGALRREMGGSPLLGMVTVKHLLDQGAASVMVTGCDFYGSGYAPEYGGERYRAYMKRPGGTISQRHDGPAQLRWLTALRNREPRLAFDDHLTALAPKPAAKKGKKTKPVQTAAARFKWDPLSVTTRHIPQMVLRTYVEQRALRDMLAPLDLESAVEVGAGFGRMTVALADLAKRVTAFEREPSLVASAAALLPQVDVQRVERLTHLPAADGAFDLAMTFTVLQHMSHADVAEVATELCRIARRYILIVEDTDPEHVFIDDKRPGHFTYGRSVKQYGSLLPGFGLIRVERREVEQTFSYKHKRRPYVGHYMLFERGAA